ncbi:alpha/beta fold hydrolase [Cupriavidus oxalaticus]|uniref:2-hydroxy-6-ketonone-2,4-dienedioic acid hydrolase n=1 Tax=Cupriavidus oxalaticus TaxID=96344 RepID=A0A375GBX1_9BURK|nr:alpha/beta fold hydrolase [Cupriavidus oxalaticus]QRQ84105.1 alpha/beta fold hydrolase [Cupriavidus oxalaticus]QRQ91806.1 alpha/beta fold hydrolase [Cupriavidus oxalaticus]WQD86396.1 alpha/beta fold hydrolase [Cupriavidus oxalaticus]SPC17739.1 2-hydroxy-6-ketonone-2,4-dienedioic acid hydrolase [Cupriavidus oxalaticus]
MSATPQQPPSSLHPNLPVGRFVTMSGGLRLHCLDAGSGEPVVFIHGSGPGASGHSNFRFNVPAFAAAGFRTVVVDLPGYGLSSKPDDVEYTLDFFVAALREQLVALELPRCVLVGNSLGGAIALKYALDYPEHVSRLVMMAPGGVEERETYFQMEGIQRMVSLFTGGHMNPDTMRQLLQLLVHDASLVTDALVDERMAVCREQPREVLATMSVPNLTARLGEIACPVLGFWGMEDQFNPASGAMKFLGGCADARFVMINRCGHWVMVEHAAYFNRECLGFLADTAPAVAA